MKEPGSRLPFESAALSMLRQLFYLSERRTKELSHRDVWLRLLTRKNAVKCLSGVFLVCLLCFVFYKVERGVSPLYNLIQLANSHALFLGNIF